jgi:hypothetical protein
MATIPARAQSADGVFEAHFDALPYFVNAEDQELMELFKGDFTGLSAAELAYSFRDSNADLARIFEHVERAHDGISLGFVCVVERAPALDWITKNRPKLAERIERRPEVDAAIERRLARLGNQGDFSRLGRS